MFAAFKIGVSAFGWSFTVPLDGPPRVRKLTLRLSRNGNLPAEFETGPPVASRQRTKAIAVLVLDHLVRTQRLCGSLVPDRFALLRLDRSQLGSFQTHRLAPSIRNSDSRDSGTLFCP